MSSCLLPAILRLCSDPVASVRHTAASQLGYVLKKSARLVPRDQHPLGEAAEDVAAQVCSLARVPHFQQRVSFALAFRSMVQHLPAAIVTSVLLRPFLELATDPVVDVRLMAATTVLYLVERCTHHKPVEDASDSQRAVAEAQSAQHSIEAAVCDPRSRDVVHGMTTDSDGGVARMALACEQRMQEGL